MLASDFLRGAAAGGLFAGMLQTRDGGRLKPSAPAPLTRTGQI